MQIAAAVAVQVQVEPSGLSASGQISGNLQLSIHPAHRGGQAKPREANQGSTASTGPWYSMRLRAGVGMEACLNSKRVGFSSQAELAIPRCGELLPTIAIAATSPSPQSLASMPHPSASSMTSSNRART